jgi:hypothetical protein
MLRKLVPALCLAALVFSACAPAPAPSAHLLIKTVTSGPPMSGCRLVNPIPSPNATLAAALPAVSDTDHIRGAKDARVTILEYSDFT